MALNFLSDLLSQSADPGSRWDTSGTPQNVQSAWGGYGQSAPQSVLNYFQGYDASPFSSWWDNNPSKSNRYTDENGFMWIPHIDGGGGASDGGDATPSSMLGYRRSANANDPNDPFRAEETNYYYGTDGKFKYGDKDDKGWLNPITGILAVASLGLGAGAFAGAGEAAGAIGAAGAGEAGGSLAAGYGAGSAGAGFGQIGLGAGAGSAGAGYGAGLGLGSTYGGASIGGGLATGAAAGGAAGLAGYGDVGSSTGFGDIGVGGGSGSGGAGYNFGQGSTFGGQSIGGGVDWTGAGGVLSDGTATMGSGAEAGSPPPANPYTSTMGSGSLGKLGGAMGEFSWTDLIGPATQLFNGAQGAKAAENASAAQLTAAREAMALSAPWREKGVGALNKLSVLLGLEGNGDPEFGALTKGFQFTQDDPSYQFRLNQGLKALKNSYAGKGRFLSGSAMKGINDYAQGAASQEYGQSFNRDLATRTNMFNRLASVAGTGQTASNTMGDLNTQAGNAQAAGQIGSANAMSNGLTNAYNTYTQNELMRRLLGGY